MNCTPASLKAVEAELLATARREHRILNLGLEGLRPPARIVRIVMTLFAEDRLSVGELARLTSLCKRSVRCALEELRAAGCSVNSTMRIDKKKRTKLYKLTSGVQFWPEATLDLARSAAQLGCSPVEKAVLIALALYAGGRNVACPAIPTLARITGYGRRAIQRTLRSLCKTGSLIEGGPSGKKYENTSIYVVNVAPLQLTALAPQTPKKKILTTTTSIYSSKSIESVFKTSAGTLPSGTNDEHEEKLEKPKPKTNPPLFGVPFIVLKPKMKAWPTGVCWRSWERVEEWLFGKKDSCLVKAWKKAREKAGLGVPTVTATQGRQLKQLTRGKNALDYAEVRDQIIPTVIAHWHSFLCFWLHANKKTDRKAPLPPEPSTGFLSRHRKIARKFVQWVQWVQQTPDYELAPDAKEYLWSQLHEYEFNTGPLPKNIPAPYNKGKIWNSPVWSGHSKEKPFAAWWEVQVVKGTWNAKSEAKALAKLSKKGVTKDKAIAVFNYVKSNWNWFDFQSQVKSQKGWTIQGNPHPQLILEHWNEAETIYEESLKKPKYKSTEGNVTLTPEGNFTLTKKPKYKYLN